MQINYNPFEPVGDVTTPVPEPTTIWFFTFALVLVLGRKKLSQFNNTRHSTTSGSCFA